MSVYREVLTPLTQRMATENPDLLPALASLKEAMGERDFEKYIERLSALKVNGDMLWITARTQIDRSILERNHREALKTAFQVKRFQILCI